MWHFLSFFVFAVGLFACGLRLTSGSMFSVGPFEFTSATSAALLASICALAVIWQQRTEVSNRLLQLSTVGSARHRTFRLISLAFLCLGTVLRIAHLNDYPLNGDEHIFVNTANADSLLKVWNGLKANHHPPANFFLLHYLQIISVNPLWLRTPSLLAGIYLIWITIRFVRELIGPVEALSVALLVTFSPALIELSRVCRNYTPGFAFSLTAMVFLVRYLRQGRIRDIFWFSFFEGISLTWLYSLIIPFLAANLILFGTLIAKKRHVTIWIPPILLQLPNAALAIFLYVAHVRDISTSSMSTLLASSYKDSLFGGVQDLFLYLPLPIMQLSQYLLAGNAGLILFTMAVIGAVQLWISGRRQILALCALPLVLAYAFRFAGLLPLGGRRHGAYLFPFLFALIGASIPALLNGLFDIRKCVAPHKTRMAMSISARARSGGLMIVASAYACFFYLSIGMQEGTIYFDRPNELPTTYDDLERAIVLLQSEVGPDDVILISWKSVV